MLTIHNPSRYITADTLRQCFRPGQVTHVDKVLCGNGFTTAFLMEKPPDGKINIIIVPNKQVILSKQKSNPSPHTMRFIYEESTNKNFDADILMFVADSFVLNIKGLLAIKNRIHWILIDEYHSVEIQSSFRVKLLRFMDNLIDFDRSAVTTVTATPNHESKIDIQITNGHTNPLKIHVTHNRDESIIRVLMSLKQGKKTLVCTNDQRTLYSLKKWDKTLTARYMIGDSLARSIVQKVIAHEDPEALLVIASSRSFEGMDLLEPDYHVYFFEDRSRKHECFYIANLYQALNRPRNGVGYAEFCRNELSERRVYSPDEAEVVRFLERTDISCDEKHSSDYSKFRPYTILKTNHLGIRSMLKNDAAIRLRRELLMYDSSYRIFKQFCENRLIEWIDLDESNQRLRCQRSRPEEQARVLFENSDYIDGRDLFGDDFVFVPKKTDNHRDFYTGFLNHLALKNYNGAREQTKMESNVLEVLSSIEVHSKALCDARLAKWLKEQSKAVAYKKLAEFKPMAALLAGEFICGFANDCISFVPLWVSQRNYNVLTKLSIANIEYLAALLGVKVYALDIRQCFPRLVYALSGLALPDDFYGAHDEDRKRRKRAKNIALNQVWYDKNSKTERGRQLLNAIDRLKSAEYDPMVIQYIIENYFDTPHKGDFFNSMAFHEKTIIGIVKGEMERFGGYKGLARRHDSIVFFDLEADISWINDFEYLGQKGWFDVQN